MNSEHIRYVGVNDHQLDLFEGQYAVPDGMSYNSYIILDERTAVMDSVDGRFTQEWLGNVARVLQGRQVDYLVVHHMEPDHSASIAALMAQYPAALVVASARAFDMMQNFHGCDYADRRVVVADGSILPLGRHTLHFMAAPMVHWPEVMTSYEASEQVLFSADAFGKFGALDDGADWVCEARRYYFGIVGKYGAQVQSLLRRIAPLKLSAICPLHGPALTDSIDRCVQLYDLWSSYRPESRGVVIAYASMYGNTRSAAACLADLLRQRGETVTLFDLARDDMAEAIEDAFRYDRLVLASPTYNGSAFPVMRSFIQQLTERSYQNRTVALIENGSWAPMAARAMLALLEGSRNLTVLQPVVRLMSAMKEDTRAHLELLAQALCQP